LTKSIDASKLEPTEILSDETPPKGMDLENVEPGETLTVAVA